jgi:hypothetical protein
MANLMNLDIKNGFCIVMSEADIVIQLLIMEIEGSSSSSSGASEGPRNLTRLRKR